MKNVPIRRAFVVAGAFVAASAMALTCASAASAAPVATQATAQGGQLRLGTQPPLTTPVAKAVWTPGTKGLVRSGSSVPEVFGTQSILTAGVAATNAVAGNNASYGCSGLLGAGGTLQVGNAGATCRAVYPSEGGVTLDLGALTSSLPMGIGGISLKANGVIANARFREGVPSGIGRIDSAMVSICLGVKLPGVDCAGSLVNVPLILRGTPNEDVISAVITSLTKTPQLATLLTPLTSALKSAVSIKTNVQSKNASTGGITVVGLQVKLLMDNVVSNLAVATAGPYSG